MNILDGEVAKLGAAGIIIALQQVWIWQLGKHLEASNKRGDDWAKEAFTVSKEAVGTMTTSAAATAEMSRSIDTLRSSVTDLRSAVDRGARAK